MKNNYTAGEMAEFTRQLLEAVRQAQENLQQVEIWAGALSAFSNPVPEYHPDNTFLLGGHGSPRVFGSSDQPHSAGQGTRRHTLTVAYDKRSAN